MLQLQHGFHQPGHSRRAFQVSHISLGSAQIKGRTAIPIDSPNGIHFNRVTKRRPGPVSLDEIHLGGGHLSALQRALQYVSLSVSVRNSQTATFTVIIDSCTSQDSPDPVVVFERRRKTLENEDSTTLTASIPISIGREGLAETVRCQCVHCAQAAHHRRREHEAAAGCEGNLALRLTQGIHRKFDGNQ